MAELRASPLNEQEWVIVSASRSGRPHDMGAPKNSNCPFCLHHEHETGEETFVFREGNVPGAPDWSVRVVHNKFPAVEPYAAYSSTWDATNVTGCSRMPAFGSHEVVVETPEHDIQLADLSIVHVQQVLFSYKERLKALREDKRIKYVQVFKNNGKEAGASLRHSHSQIIALPLVPEQISWRVSNCKQHFETHGKCLMCDMVKSELEDGSRIIDQSPGFVSFAPFASRFPYEIWIVPLKHRSNFEECNDTEMHDLADLLHLTVKKLVKQLKDTPYNYFLYNNTCEEDINSPYFHWYICIIPRTGVLAGFELATGCHINTVLPEKAAQLFRDTEL